MRHNLIRNRLRGFALLKQKRDLLPNWFRLSSAATFLRLFCNLFVNFDVKVSEIVFLEDLSEGPCSSLEAFVDSSNVVGLSVI